MWFQSSLASWVLARVKKGNTVGILAKMRPIKNVLSDGKYLILYYFMLNIIVFLYYILICIIIV